MKYQRFDELPAWQEAARLYQRLVDWFEEPNVPVSASVRGQLERAALAVSNKIAQSRDRMPSSEAAGYLVEARAAAAEVQSIMAVISQRPKLTRWTETMQQIRTLAESCARQLSAWVTSIEHGPRASKQPEAQPGPVRQQPASTRASTA